MKKEVAKMIRIEACQKIGNHEYVRISTRSDGKEVAYECKHCKEIWVTTPKTEEELQSILMKW